jgi:maltose-binding protein MalE
VFHLEEVYIHNKIFFAISIIVLTAIVLIGCTPSIPESTQEQIITELPKIEEEPKEEPTEEPVITEIPEIGLRGQVSIWHSFDENEVESLNGVIAIFQEMHPEVEFDVLYIPAYDIHGKFESAAQSGSGACILIGPYAWGPPLFDSFLVAEVSEFASDEFLATINPAALGSVQYADSIIGLPLSQTGILPFRNKNIVPVAPTTFDEMVTLAQEATSGDVVGAYLDYGLFLSAGHLHGIGGSLMDADGNPTFNDDKGIEWIEMIQKFEEAGPVENNNDNDINLFIEGKAGMIIDGWWNASNLAEAIGPENLAIDPWPDPMSGYVQTENLYLNANSTSNELDTCKSFMEFMLSPEAQLIFADSSMAGFIPSILGVELTDPLQMQVVETFNGATAFPVIPEMNAYWDPVNNALLTVMEQGADPADVLQEAHDDVLAELAEIQGE